MPSSGNKKLIRSLAALSGLALFSSVGSIQNAKNAAAATATMPILVNLVHAIEMTLNTAMSFGTLAITSERAGQAKLEPGLDRLVTGGSGSLAIAGGKPQVGRLNIKGAVFPISISVEDTTIKLTNGLASVTINEFNIMTENGGHRMDYTPTAPSFTLPIGATLNTKPAQPTGTYVGNTRIFINFQ